MRREMTGGCQCGRVRYRVTVDDDEASLCHCRMCQRATGGVAAALKEVAMSAITWTDHEPDRYRSSPIARRGFCSACGTPLTYERDGLPDLELTVGSFDDPFAIVPVRHFGIESVIESWLDTRGLPTVRTADNPRLVQAWREATGHGPE